MSKERPRLSFIIPAKNEEDSIQITLASIDKWCNFPHEVIVVDHNSSDGTRGLSEQLGAHVVTKVGGTISSVRNIGAIRAKGDILVFLDADISLTNAWCMRLPHVLSKIHNDPMLLTGSHCSAPSDDGWLSKYWFSRFSQSTDTVHIGSGHLIMSKFLFKKLNGFDETIATGEDYDICSRASLLGSRIVNDEALKVIHRDYPKTISGLIARESWHGLGDTWPPRRIASSKVAIATLAFIFLHFVILSLMFMTGPSTPFIAIPVLSIFLITLLSSTLKFRHNGFRLVLLNSILFYFYYVGRSMSFLRKAFNKNR